MLSMTYRALDFDVCGIEVTPNHDNEEALELSLSGGADLAVKILIISVK